MKIIDSHIVRLDAFSQFRKLSRGLKYPCSQSYLKHLTRILVNTIAAKYSLKDDESKKLEKVLLSHFKI